MYLSYNMNSYFTIFNHEEIVTKEKFCKFLKDFLTERKKFL